MNPDFWTNRSVFLTGHTGFKGGWIGMWLSHMGAKVHGYSLEPPTTPNFFSETNLKEYLEIEHEGFTNTFKLKGMNRRSKVRRYENRHIKIIQFNKEGLNVLN